MFTSRRRRRPGGCGCCSCLCVGTLFILVAVLFVPFRLGNPFATPVPTGQSLLCRQFRLEAANAAGNSAPPFRFALDAGTGSNWAVLEAPDGNFAWLELGAVPPAARQSILQQLQANNVPPLFLDLAAAAFAQTSDAGVIRQLLLSPFLQNCGSPLQERMERSYEQRAGRTGFHAPIPPPGASLAADAPIDSAPAVTGTVNVGANIRTGPGQEYDIASVAPQGTQVTIAATSEDGDWFQLSSGDWIFAALVDLSEVPARASLPPSSSFPAPTLAPRSALPQAQANQLTVAELSVLKNRVLAHVNGARARHGARAVALGSNAAAQEHAEELLRGRYLSHWNRDGFAPYMRYARAGGQGYSAENVSLTGYLFSQGCRAIDMDARLEEALQGLMDSPGHRDNILRSEHTTLHAGLAQSCGVLTIVQLFEGDYVRYDSLPYIRDGILRMAGRTINGAALPDTSQPFRVSWVPLPQPVTRGQLIQTSCYSGGQPIAALLRPSPPGTEYVLSAHDGEWIRCPTPYDVDPELVYPSDPRAFARILQAAQNNDKIRAPYSAPAIIAQRWQEAGTAFEIEADLSSLLDKYGAGVYTIGFWGQLNGQSALLSEYSLFVE